MCCRHTHFGISFLGSPNPMLSPVFVFKNAKHTEKIKNNTVKNLSAFHLDSEIVHVLPHLFYFFIVFFSFFWPSHLKVSCRQYCTLPLKTSLSPKNKDSLLHNQFNDHTCANVDSTRSPKNYDPKSTRCIWLCF